MNFYDFRDITNHAVTLIFLDTDKVKDMKKNLINHMATILSALSSLNDDLKKSLQYYCTHMSAEFLEELLAKTKEISVVANFATTEFFVDSLKSIDDLRFVFKDNYEYLAMIDNTKNVINEAIIYNEDIVNDYIDCKDSLHTSLSCVAEDVYKEIYTYGNKLSITYKDLSKVSKACDVVIYMHEKVLSHNKERIKTLKDKSYAELLLYIEEHTGKVLGGESNE